MIKGEKQLARVVDCVLQKHSTLFIVTEMSLPYSKENATDQRH